MSGEWEASHLRIPIEQSFDTALEAVSSQFFSIQFEFETMATSDIPGWIPGAVVQETRNVGAFQFSS
ncbi:hypothetical protein GGI07_004315 [Coemansia sp. Benny D115]|nr:hypothetical protein GGI07_004315 [Coemansia sp. Benny D115]